MWEFYGRWQMDKDTSEPRMSAKEKKICNYLNKELSKQGLSATIKYLRHNDKTHQSAWSFKPRLSKKETDRANALVISLLKKIESVK